MTAARPYTVAEARFILSHVYCVHHVPDGGGFIYRWSPGAGEPLCCRCSCCVPADLRLYVAGLDEAATWCAIENVAVNTRCTDSAIPKDGGR